MVKPLRILHSVNRHNIKNFEGTTAALRGKPLVDCKRF